MSCSTMETSMYIIINILCNILIQILCSKPLRTFCCTSKPGNSILNSSTRILRSIFSHPKEDTSNRVSTKVLYEKEKLERQKPALTLNKKDQTWTKKNQTLTKKVQTLTKKIQSLTKLVNKQKKGARTYRAAGKAHENSPSSTKTSARTYQATRKAHARTRSTKTSPSEDTKTSVKAKKQTNKQKTGARTYQAAGKAHARAAKTPKLSTLKVPAHRILSTLKTSPPGITSVTMKLKGLPQKNITGFYNQTRNEILKLLDQQEEKLPQEAMYMHIKTVQKYEEYDLWLKDKHHKALIVEKLDGNVITIADTSVGVSITSRTLQARKKVAKQQTQPNMEKHVSPASTTEQERTVAEKAEQDLIVAEKAVAI